LIALKIKAEKCGKGGVWGKKGGEIGYRFRIKNF